MRWLTKQFLYAGLMVLGASLIIGLATEGSLLTGVVVVFGLLLVAIAVALRIIRWLAG